MIYLACPYSHESKLKRIERFNQVKIGTLIKIDNEWGIKCRLGMLSYFRNGKFREIATNEEVEIKTA